SGERGALGFTGLVTHFQFANERPSRKPEAAAEQKRSFIELGLVLHQSLQQNYLFGVDLDYVNSLSTPLAQRLYLYLTKKDQRSTHTEGLKALAPKLGLAKLAPSAIRAAIAPALDALLSETSIANENSPRRFLRTWEIDAEKQQLTVTFHQDRKS